MAKFVRETNSQKWQNHRADQYVLTIADMDMPLPATLKTAISTRLQLVNNFTYKQPSKQYYEAIIDWYRDRHIKESNVQITTNQIVESPSLLNIIYILIRNFSKQDDGVLLLTPVFVSYRNVAKQLGRKVIECKLYNDRNKNVSRYDINFTDLQEKAKNAKIMIFCNPHNPTGRIWTKKEILRIVSICKKYQILLISDEILCDLLPDKFRDNFYSLINCNYERIVVCNSISKAFNMQSLKGGYAIIKNEQIRQNYNHILKNHLNLHTSQFTLICTEIVYSKEGKQWLQNVVAPTVSRNYDYLIKKIKNSLLVVSRFEGVYIIVLNFDGYLKFIERWFHNQYNGSQKVQNMIKVFLRSHKIVGVQLPYLGLYDHVFTDIRFTIGTQQGYFRRFTDTLVSALYEIQYQYREIDSKL